MKVSQVSILAVMIVVIAVAFAGCTGSEPAAPAASSPQAGGEAAGGAQVPVATAAPDSGSTVDLFGASYNWVEYKTSSNAGGDEMTIYMKWTKEGKCTMRFEGAGAEAMAGMPSDFDCSTTGNAEADNNPNDVDPDVKLVKVGTETVTVGAGTFVADKYTVTSEGMTATYWFVADKPVLKMEGSTSEGTVVTELNGWG